MAPTLFNFKELRRRSRASFRNSEQSTDTSSDGATSHETAPSNGSSTPPSIAHQSDPAINLQLKNSGPYQPQARPPLAPVPNTNRYSSHSVSGMSGLGAPSIHGRPSLPVSQYAPRIQNVSENAWVYQKALLIHGTIGDPSQQAVNGMITVGRLDDGFPPIDWPVCNSHFKALVYLQPGPNRLRFDFNSPKLVNCSSSNPIHASYLTVHMLPMNNAPPLQLAILVGKDSPETFDSPPAKAEREGNGLETAIQKFRMAAYLWQAFTAEQMWRNKLGRRAFRFEEEWIPSTANYRDRENGTMRSEARVHVIRSDKTVAEIRDLNKAQQYGPAQDKNGLYGIAADAVRKHFKPQGGHKQYVTVLILDAQWDKTANTIRGHAALGGGTGDLQLGIFGSHCLHSYPTCFEEIVDAFTDCTPTDTTYVANDCGDAGSSWEAANIGIGAHLHETGHLFGCPHQESGIMLRDYVVLNRSFVIREAFSTRTKSRGGIALQKDECTWHRLDCLRFRAHPAFRLPNDPPMNADDSVQMFPIESGKVLAVAATGISFVEVYGEGDDVCRTWIEYPADGGHVQKQITLSELDLRGRMPENKRKGRVKVSIKSYGGGSTEIDDFKTFTSKSSSVKLDGGKVAFRSQKLGHSKMEGSTPQDLVFTSTTRHDRVLSKVIVYHGSAVDGVEFIYDDESSQLFGKKGGKKGGDTFDLDIRRGEYISGFAVRSGFWIDGIQILTSLGRKSPMFGNAFGGDAHNLLPPRGFTLCGVSGSCGRWLDGFSILINR